MTNHDVAITPELARGSLRFLRDMMNLQEKEVVLLTADSSTDPRLTLALQASAYELGARLVTMLLSPPLPFSGGLADPYIPEPLSAAAQCCDVWVDTCWPYMAGSLLFDRVVKNGRTRYIVAGDIGAEGLINLYGRTDLDKIFAVSMAMGDYIASSGGKTCRITTPLGTDVTFEVEPDDGAIKGLCSSALEPGGYFHTGTTVILPVLESVKGTIVAETCMHSYYTELRDPLRFEVDGKIRSFTGGGPESYNVDQALRRAAKGDYGYIVHFTNGYHPAARFTGRSFMQDQRVAGANAVGFGFPPWLDGGGENHPDCVMTAQSIWIDGQLVVDNGETVFPDSVVSAINAVEVQYN